MSQGNHNHSAGADHGSYKSYITGFILAVILTVIPFWLVMGSGFAKSTIALWIVLFAVAQVLVHLVYFLHLNTSSEQRWNSLAFAYTVLLVVILIGGSVWIMYHLHLNMVM